MVSVGEFDRFAFIVGAPRCGTTTLAEFLKGHQSVSFPFVKEPHFFSQNDLRDLGTPALRDRVEREYLGRFFRADGRRRMGVDASVTYLYTPEQLEPILRLWPDSRFVIALRDPLSMLPSLHRRLIYLGDETIADFSKAWAAVPDRAAGRRIPRGCADPRWLRYDLAARFSDHLERLFAVVGRDRCHVILFDDLAADPGQEYQSFMDFVGVEPAVRPDFTARREGRDVRIRWLQRLLKRPPNAVREYFAGEHYRRRVCDLDATAPASSPGGVLSLRKRLLRWNRVSRPAKPLSSTLAAEIRGEFASDIQRLGQLLDRDLTPWLRSGESGPPGLPSEESVPIGLRREALSH
jgi:hypothetical protein